MSKIFIEVYLDENVHVLIAKIVWEHGFKAVTTQDVGAKGQATQISWNGLVSMVTLF